MQYVTVHVYLDTGIPDIQPWLIGQTTPKPIVMGLQLQALQASEMQEVCKHSHKRGVLKAGFSCGDQQAFGHGKRPHELYRNTHHQQCLSLA